MNEYHQIHGRSLRVGCDGRPRGPDSTDLDSLSAPEEPGLRAAGLRAPPPPSVQKVRAGARDFRAEGLGTPARPEKRRSLSVRGRHRPGSRLTAVRRGKGSVRSGGLGPSATRRSASSARPPRNRRRRYHHRHRPPLRAQRAEGPTASHAARRQRLAPGAPPSLSAHWQAPPPL